MKIYQPGSTIGIVGSGQLGRMFTSAAKALGYQVHTYSPEKDSPTGQLADKEIVASYDDLEALKKFATEVDLVTFEFENVSSSSLKQIEELVPVRPSAETLLTFQHRLREKQFLAENKIPLAEFAYVTSKAELEQALKTIGYPSVLKTAGFGYDGKGQTKLKTPEDLSQLTDQELSQGHVLEKFITFDREVSIVAARDEADNFAFYPITENVHTNHILDYTLARSTTDPKLQRAAEEIARVILTKLNTIGLMCVEFFVVGESLLVNEVAPRPHNSGHYTIDACKTSQFEQQLRAITGIGLGETTLKSEAAMLNILGDSYKNQKLNTAPTKDFPDVTLHLYGKTDPRPGRKMGHLTATGEDATLCLKRAQELKAKLSS